jgi:DNA-binding transcriptional regulator/RsmH inhibitor MraZ
MILPVDDKLFAKGFCLGVYEVTVDAGPRIRLPRPVARILLDREVERVWVFPDPTGPRLIICPDCSRRIYIKVAQENLPKSSPAGKAYREFICDGRPIALRDHGWISVASFSSEGFTAGADDSVVIVGTGLWYELWRQDDWFTSAEETGR